jgi:hypothetical protein
MARIFIDGFESGNFGLWDVRPRSASGSVQNTVKYNHDYAAAFSYNQTYALKNLLSAVSTIYFQFRFRFSATPVTTDSAIFGVFNNSTTQACLRVNHTSAKLEVCKGTGTVKATGSVVLAANTWYLIEGKITIDSASGVFQVKVNGAAGLDIDFSGDTQGGADTNITRAAIGDWFSNTITGFPNIYFDDFVLDDAALPGGTLIMGVNPAGRGLDVGWTPSSGFNYSCVDELSISDSDKVSATAVDTVDLYPVTPLPQLPGTVIGVQFAVMQWKTGSPSAANLKLAVKTNGTVYPGATLTPTSIRNSLSEILSVNPNTSAAWTATELRDMRIGIKSSS